MPLQNNKMKNQFNELLLDEIVTIYLDIDKPIKGYIKKELNIEKLDRQRFIREFNNLSGDTNYDKINY
jgi:hypothetical protein